MPGATAALATSESTGDTGVIEETATQTTTEEVVESATDTQTTAEASTETTTTETATEEAVVQNWPDNWRELAADGDEKLAKELARIVDPKALVKSWKESRALISSGKLKAPLPENATPEQLAEWRKKNDVPETPDGYSMDLGDGIVLGEDDIPIVKTFMEHAHKVNMPAPYVTEALRWYNEFNENLAVQQVKDDREHEQTRTRELRADWGHQYQANMTVIETMIDPEQLDILRNARDERTGQKIWNNAGLVRALAQLSLVANPQGTPIPGTGSVGGIESITEEMQNLEKMMRSPNSDYWKGPKAESLQERYRLLVDAKQAREGAAPGHTRDPSRNT